MKAKILLALLALTVFSAKADDPCEVEWSSTSMSQVKAQLKKIYYLESKEPGSTVENIGIPTDAELEAIFDSKNGLRKDRFPTKGEIHEMAVYDGDGDFTGSTSRQSLEKGDKVVWVKVNDTEYPVAVIRDCTYLSIMDGISNAPAPAPKETTKDGGLQEENEKLREKLAFLENNGGSGKTDATVEKKDGNIHITVNVLGGDSKAINGDVNGASGAGGGGTTEITKYVVLNADGSYAEVPDDQIQTVLQAQRGRSWRTVNGVRYMGGQNSALVSYTQQSGCTNCGFPLSRNGRPLSSNADIATAVGVWVQPVMAPLYTRMWDAILGGGGRSSAGGSIYRPIGGGGRGWGGGGGGSAWTGGTH
jgi:hypothetical protein